MGYTKLAHVDKYMQGEKGLHMCRIPSHGSPAIVYGSTVLVARKNFAEGHNAFFMIQSFNLFEVDP